MAKRAEATGSTSSRPGTDCPYIADLRFGHENRQMVSTKLGAAQCFGDADIRSARARAGGNATSELMQCSRIPRMPAFPFMVIGHHGGRTAICSCRIHSCGIGNTRPRIPTGEA